MPNRKASGPDGLPAERLNIDHPAFVQCFDNNILVNVWVLGEVLQHWKIAILKVLQNTKDRTDCNNYTGISLLAHTGKVLLKIVTSASTARMREQSRRNSTATSPPHDQRFVCSSPCAGCKSSSDRGKPPFPCASSICRKLTTLPTESCCGRYTLTQCNTVGNQCTRGSNVRSASTGPVYQGTASIILPGWPVC